MAALQVDDGEPALADPGVADGGAALVVGSAVDEAGEHARPLPGVDFPVLSGDPAHGLDRSRQGIDVDGRTIGVVATIAQVGYGPA